MPLLRCNVDAAPEVRTLPADGLTKRYREARACSVPMKGIPL
jgi:hypothetical protein